MFFAGCPLRCLWCQNPEAMERKPGMVFNRSECIGCLECMAVCRQEATSLGSDGRLIINRQKCRLCGACLESCPSKARKLSAKAYTVAQLLDEIIKDLVFFSQTQGGVTFSGGEPTFQADFLLEILKRCKDRRIHTAIETCGHAEWQVIERLSDHIDLFLYDLKLVNPAKHKTWTGVDNRLILQNLRALAASGRKVIVRIPLIPGVNDDEAEFADMVSFCESLMTVETIHILPFHQLGLSKYESLDKKYAFAEKVEQNEEAVNRCARIATSRGFFVSIGGGEYKKNQHAAARETRPSYFFYSRNRQRSS